MKRHTNTLINQELKIIETKIKRFQEQQIQPSKIEELKRRREKLLNR